MAEPLEEEWRNFELYEKVRIREQKKRFWLIALAGVVFFGLCAVPVIEQRLPKWTGLDAARSISLVLEHLKTRAIQERKPLRIRFNEDGKYQIEILNECKDEIPIKLAEEGVWPSKSGMLKVLTRSELSRFSIGLGVESVCFDPVFGLAGTQNKQVLVVVPVKDLSEDRLDRASYIVLQGESANISIN